jgi:hypothetical protein
VVSDEYQSPSLSPSAVPILDMYKLAVLEWDDEEEEEFSLLSLDSDLMVDESHEISGNSSILEQNINSAGSVRGSRDERDNIGSNSGSESFTGFQDESDNSNIVNLNRVINELSNVNISSDVELSSDNDDNRVQTRARGPVQELPNVQGRTLERKYRRKE